MADKPQGLTSHDCVKIIRKRFGIKKVGHAGTLDPLATGILILLLGRATRLFADFSGFDKEYEATLTLGLATDTGDIQGSVIQSLPYEHIKEEDVLQGLSKFQGAIEQIPPMVSALKYQGKRLYELARRGITVPRSSRKIFIRSLLLIRFAPPEIDFKVQCSKGTYVRKLGEDIGQLLGSVGCISKIRRIASGPFRINEAVKLADINESHLRNWPY